MTVPILIALAALNLCTFLAFGFDKRRAKLGKRRVSEARLIGLSWFGGLFGGWLAMKTFRHKTRKSSFRTRMVIVSVVNFAWLWIYLAIESA
ncbi:MAG: DUF1294 domain-containing protein [Planctomycetota bacterium]